MESAKLGEPAYIKSRSAVSFWPGLLRDAQVPCCAPWSCEDARKCYVSLWVLKGLRVHRAKLKPQTNQRKCFPEAFHLVPGSPGTQNVTAANGFVDFPIRLRFPKTVSVFWVSLWGQTGFPVCRVAHGHRTVFSVCCVCWCSQIGFGHVYY